MTDYQIQLCLEGLCEVYSEVSLTTDQKKVINAVRGAFSISEASAQVLLEGALLLKQWRNAIRSQVIN